VHFRAGSLSANPLCCTTPEQIIRGRGRLSLDLVARVLHRLRAALAVGFLSPHGLDPLCITSPAIRKVRGPQAEPLPSFNAPRSGPHRRPTQGRQPGLQLEAPGTVPRSGAAPRAYRVPHNKRLKLTGPHDQRNEVGRLVSSRVRSLTHVAAGREWPAA
jgi:hypothetical protein